MVETNKLIAEFIGLVYRTKYQYEGWYDNSEFKNRICDFDGLRYHLEWNWLMPVVHKCLSFCDDEWKQDFSDAFLSKDIDKMYNRVVNFIGWWNEIR